MKRVLLIAYHFPPLRGSSGLQRTLRFAQYLPQYGWETAVLTVHPQAYDSIGSDLLGELPADVPVVRAFALDAARHLSIGGRYPHWLARPDRWVSWRLPAVRAGMRLVAEWRPDALWSTFPIATAHRIGLDLHRRTSLPWIADFRDPMAQPDYPPDARLRAALAELEADVARSASACTFVTERARARCSSRYPDLPAERFSVIENGFDEASFTGLATTRTFGPEVFVLLHSGLIDAADRDPTVLLRALAILRREGTVGPATFRLAFRAPGDAKRLADGAESAGVGDLVAILPAIGYREALAEMLGANALLVLQGASCPDQVPAKVYECARSGRPILGLVEPGSASDSALAALGVRERLETRDPARLAGQLRALLAEPAGAAACQADRNVIGRWSRERLAERLAVLLSGVTRR